MFRFLFVLAFLFLSGGCFSEINKAKETDSGVEVDDGDIPDSQLVHPDAEVVDMRDQTPDAIVDASPTPRDAQVSNPDATTPDVDASLAPDVETADAQVTADIGQIADAAIADATPPVLDATPTCESDRDCGTAGGICTGGICKVVAGWSVWCWDYDAEDDNSGTCHDNDEHGGNVWSPVPWRLSQYPNQPPVCGSNLEEEFYPSIVQCCRGSSDWNNEESEDFRDCEPQPDGSPLTWDPYNN